MLNEYKKEFFSFDQDWGYVIYPENISKDIPVVLHFHGNIGYVKDGRADWLDEPKKQKLFTKTMLNLGLKLVNFKFYNYGPQILNPIDSLNKNLQ